MCFTKEEESKKGRPHKMRRWMALPIAMMLLSAALPASASGSALSDLEGHWAREQVEAGVAAGYISGYPDGTFRPDADVTRAEFFKLLGAAMRLTPDPDLATGLREESTGHWAFTQGHIPAAVSAGLLYPPDYGNALEPDLPITRREIVMATVRALGMQAVAQQGGLTLTAADADEYEPWLQQYAAVAMDQGIVRGFPDGTVGLERRATRAEAVVMVQRVRERITAEVREETGPVLPNMTRHPAEGEPTWSHTGTTVTVTDGAVQTTYPLPEGAEEVRLLPAPGSAAWVVYSLDGTGVVARLAGGETHELEHRPDGPPTPLAVDDAGQLWVTDASGKLQVVDAAGQVWTNDAVGTPLDFGAIDWYGRFWGMGDGKLYRIDPSGLVTRYDPNLGGLGPVRHFALGEEGAVWVITGAAGDGPKARALLLQDGHVERVIPLVNRYYGGLGAEAGVEVIGRSGPYLWLTGQTGAGQDGLYRLDTTTGAFTRLVLPQTIGDGATALPASGGGVVVTDGAGRFWRILP